MEQRGFGFLVDPLYAEKTNGMVISFWLLVEERIKYINMGKIKDTYVKNKDIEYILIK
jgi:hypothetical protein